MIAGATAVSSPPRAGTSDHKLTELVTNMLDSVLLRRAVEELGDEVFEPEKSAELFETPATAVHDLFGPDQSLGATPNARVELRSAGRDRKRERTVVFRDLGIGMRPEDIAASLLRVGSSRKDGVLWLMGAFGRGGLTVLPNAHGWIVLTRSSLTPEAGVVLTVVHWQRVGIQQTQTALYQVVSPWERDGDRADPLVLPAAACADFDCGTRIAVVGFRAEGIGISRLGDERSLDTVIDTRLFEPPLPVHLTAPVLEERRARLTQLRGLGRRLADNPREDRTEGDRAPPVRIREAGPTNSRYGSTCSPQGPTPVHDAGSSPATTLCCSIRTGRSMHTGHRRSSGIERGSTSSPTGSSWCWTPIRSRSNCERVCSQPTGRISYATRPPCASRRNWWHS